MNYKILQRVLEELNKEKPDISYLKGMVETLVCSIEPVKGYTEVKSTPMIDSSVPAPIREMDAGRIPNIGRLKEFIDKSVVTEN